GRPGAVPMEAPDHAGKGGCDESFLRVGVVEPAHLERDQAFLTEIDSLLELPRLQIPEVDPLSVPAGLDVRRVEARLVRVRFPELGRDEHVLARLVPEVVVQPRNVAPVLPAALELEGLRIEDGEASGAVAFG